MSPRPAIFISAVSKELRSARQLVSNTLTFLGYEPEWQDIFSTEEGGREEFRQALERAGFDGASLIFKLHTIRWIVPTARFAFEAERHAGVRTAGLLARQTPEALDAIQSAIENAVRPFAKGDGFAIPKAAYIIAISKS